MNLPNHTDDVLKQKKKQLEENVKLFEELEQKLKVHEQQWNAVIDEFDNLCLPHPAFVKLQMEYVQEEGAKAIEQVDNMLKEMSEKVEKTII